MKNKFMKIFEELTAEIKDGRIRPGEYLPSENELCEAYGTSRETIRKALKLLSEDGYIQKMQGKGSIVLDYTKLDFPVSGLVSFKELTERLGQRVHTHVSKLEQIKADMFLQEEMRLDADADVWEVIRVREIDGEKIILDKDFLTAESVPGLTEEICRNSIYAYAEQELNLTIGYAKKEITIERPTAEDRELLDLEGFDSIVVVRSHTYLENTVLFQLTESRHRPDKFRFVDFARRK